MTFVLNVLHDEYSLLAADRQANIEGPTTIKMANTTVQSPEGLKIEGISKMKANKCGAVAVGIAGSLKAHTYFDSFQRIDGVDNSIKAILDTMRSFFWSPGHGQSPSTDQVRGNEGIATFFNAVESKYLSLLYIFSPSHQISSWNYVESGSAKLLHLGTGSSEFEKTVGLEEINRFIESIKSSRDPRAGIDWIKDAFEKVSLVAKGVGKTPEFLLSTRAALPFKMFA